MVVQNYKFNILEIDVGKLEDLSFFELYSKFKVFLGYIMFSD